MKVIAVSDIHCNSLKDMLEGEQYDADLLLIGGDLTLRGTSKELALFEHDLKWAAGEYTYVVWIAGNHDMGLEDDRALGRKISRAAGSNVIYLYESGVTLDGIRIWGSPWVPEFGSWAFMYPRRTTRWNQIPQCDVLVTHGPPYGILDRTPRDENVGCWDLLHKVTGTSPKPKVHVFGHIHSGHGFREEAGIRFYNVAMCDEWNRVVQLPTTFEV